MNKPKKWLLAASVATVLAANGLVLAAMPAERQDTAGGAQHAFVNKEGFEHQREMGHFWRNNTALLELLKIDAATLKSELKAGKSLATIAGEHGVSEQTLKNFLVNQISQRLDEAVKAGRLDADKVAKMKAGLEPRVTAMIHREGLLHNGHGPMHRLGMFQNPELLALLKIDAETLRAELKAGKTLAAIAEEHGVTAQELKDFLVSEMSKKIDEDVNAGRISAEKAEKIKANLPSRVADLINGQYPKHGHKFGGDK